MDLIASLIIFIQSNLKIVIFSNNPESNSKVRNKSRDYMMYFSLNENYLQVLSNLKFNQQFYCNIEIMDNPEHSYHTIDPSTLYKYDNHTNIPWNIPEYHTPRLEINVDLQQKKRKWQSQKKGEKDTKYVTKRGFYMDYELKVAKGIPSTFAHGAQKEWDFEKLKKMSAKTKVDPKLTKYTYLERIEMEQKNRKSPGICTYSLEKSIKEKGEEREKLKKLKVSVGEKIFFYQNTERLSGDNPGPGNYCPHLTVSKDRLNKTDYKFWVKKHKDEAESFLKRDLVKPAPGTHSPMNTTLSTFDQLATELSKPTKKQYLGTDAKFEYARENKKKMVEKRPDPSSYTTTFQWKGKQVSPKKTIWNDLVWKGSTHSVYH